MCQVIWFDYPDSDYLDFIVRWTYTDVQKLSNKLRKVDNMKFIYLKFVKLSQIMVYSETLI